MKKSGVGSEGELGRKARRIIATTTASRPSTVEVRVSRVERSEVERVTNEEPTPSCDASVPGKAKNPKREQAGACGGDFAAEEEARVAEGQLVALVLHPGR